MVYQKVVTSRHACQSHPPASAFTRSSVGIAPGSAHQSAARCQSERQVEREVGDLMGLHDRCRLRWSVLSRRGDHRARGLVLSQSWRCRRSRPAAALDLHHSPPYKSSPTQNRIDRIAASMKTEDRPLAVQVRTAVTHLRSGHVQHHLRAAYVHRFTRSSSAPTACGDARA